MLWQPGGSLRTPPLAVFLVYNKACRDMCRICVYCMSACKSVRCSHHEIMKLVQLSHSRCNVPLDRIPFKKGLHCGGELVHAFLHSITS